MNVEIKVNFTCNLIKLNTKLDSESLQKNTILYF